MDNPEISDRVFYCEDFAAFKELFVSANGSDAMPAYISVDKDVLSKDVIMTNWDQGDMTLEELMKALNFLKDHCGDNIVSVDVCGECTMDDPKAFDALGFAASNRINDEVISIFS